MDQNEIIGAKLKACRQEKHLTLKQLSEQVELSVGFLSQVERGRAALSLNTLTKLAAALGTDVAAFFGETPQAPNEGLVVRSYERRFLRTSDQFIQYSLSPDVHHTEIFPEIYELYPGEHTQEAPFQHEQEEFDYVLEGVPPWWRGGSTPFTRATAYGCRPTPPMCGATPLRRWCGCLRWRCGCAQTSNSR